MTFQDLGIAKITIGIMVIYILFIIYTYTYEYSYDNIMGFWTAPASFLAESGAEHIVLFIGAKPDGLYDRILPLGGQRRECYLMIQSEGKLTANEMFSVYITRRYSTGKEYEYTFTVDGDIKPFPSDMTLKYDDKFSRITLYSNDTVYLSLYRDNEMSETAYKNTIENRKGTPVEKTDSETVS